MTTQTIHYFELPPAQSDYRCGLCGLTWQRMKSMDMVQSSSYTHFFTRERETDGWFHCCQGRAFKWADDGEGDK